MQSRMLASIILLLTLAPAFAAKTDVVLLVNGNAITGEIKSLDFGSLRYSTDSMGTVNIDWEDIVGITSHQHLQVEVTSGKRYLGNLETSQQRFHVSVVTRVVEVEIATSDIVRITPIETDDRLYKRLDGSISFGFDTTKSSGVTVSTLAADVHYRAETYLVGLTANSNITLQPSADTSVEEHAETRRYNVGLNYQRFRPSRWFTDWNTGWERNDELGIRSRYSAGGGLGRYFVQTNKSQLSWSAGLNATQTAFTGTDDSTATLEGLLQARWRYRSIVPESSFNFTTNVYPLLEDLSQFRAKTDLSFRRELIEDLFFEISLYHDYTSDPPTDAEKEDYGITTSLGYSF